MSAMSVEIPNFLKSFFGQPNSPTMSDSLRDVIAVILQRNKNYEDKRFIPQSELKQLTTDGRNTIEKMCGIRKHKSSKDLDNLIGIVAALISYEKLNKKTYRALVEAGITDSHLPVHYDQDRKVFVSEARIVQGVMRDMAEFKQFLPTLADCLAFAEEWQHSFCIPSFGGGEYSQFHSNCVLPIFRYSEKSESGSFGVVVHVTVHHAHLNQGHRELALKELQADRWQDVFDREREALSKIQHLNHDHLINLVASFKRGKEKFYFLFPWADKGDLRNFWSQPANEFGEQPEVTAWAVRQMFGIADGIKMLHILSNSLDGDEEYGRHGDLKPENIVVFNDDKGNSIGKLRITDAGLARFHSKITKDRTAGTTTTGGTIEYAPPESRKEGDNVKRSRMYDIWSLGCIFLEFIIWVVEGPIGVTDFRKEREKRRANAFNTFVEYEPYYKINQVGQHVIDETYEIHPKVQNRILSIRADPRYAGDLLELVDMIETGLLVIEESARWTAKKLVDEFGRRIDVASAQEERVQAETAFSNVGLDSQDVSLVSGGREKESHWHWLSRRIIGFRLP